MIIRRGIKQFIDIPFPEAIQYDRKHSQTIMSKGIKVISEYFSSNLCSIGLMIDVGSKNDGKSSGLAFLSSQMLFSGTKSKNRREILNQFHELGHFSINVLRDAT